MKPGPSVSPTIARTLRCKQGHLNDFVQVAMLRAGVVEAVQRNGALGFEEMGAEIFGALDFQPEDFLREPVDSGPGYEQGKQAMVALLEYRALEDLSRGWRITQPNLEQTGLLRINYYGLEELAADDARWRSLPAIGHADEQQRLDVLKAFLDHLRMNLAIDAESLTEPATRRLAVQAGQWLREPWRLEESDRLRRQGIALLPGVQPSQSEGRQRGILRLGARSAMARYLRSSRTWGVEGNLSTEEAEDLVTGIVAALRGHLLSVVTQHGQDRGVRLLAAGMRWAASDGRPMAPDPVRTRSLYLRREINSAGAANAYFTNLYQEQARHLRGMLAAEHTGQVAAETRIEREEQFTRGELSCTLLFSDDGAWESTYANSTRYTFAMSRRRQQTTLSVQVGPVGVAGRLSSSHLPHKATPMTSTTSTAEKA